MEERVELAKKIALIFRRSRYESQKSQEYMAMGIGVSKKTIQNWESGTSCPTIVQTEQWFRLLGVNPLKLYLEIMLPPSAHKNQHAETSNIDETLQQLTSVLSVQGKEVLIYLLSEKHGSSIYALLQMIAAHLQVPLKNRVLSANIILQSYEMEKELGRLICPDEVQPDIKFLIDSINIGKINAEKQNNSYFPSAYIDRNEKKKEKVPDSLNGTK